MYVCLCNRVTDREIKQAVDAGISELHQIRAQLGVSGQCGSCADLAQSIIDEHLAGRAAADGLFYAVA